MSGFKMHRFRTIDRPLTKPEMQEIDSWSSRFSPTSMGVNYIYHYGSFGQNANRIFHKYFDAMLYVDNWGTKQLMFRFPKKLVDWNALMQFTNIKGETSLGFRKKENYVVMDLCWNNEEGDGWIEEDDYLLDPLLSLREEILKGDYRSLYLGWLVVEQHDITQKEEDFDDEEDFDEEYVIDPPAIPANLKDLSAAQQYLIETFEIDQNLVKAAATGSPNSDQQKPNYKQLIQLLSPKEKDDFLWKFAKGVQRTEVELQQRLNELGGSKNLAFGDPLSWETLKEIAEQKKRRSDHC